LISSTLVLSGRFVSNLFDEFWPDIKRNVFRRRAMQVVPPTGDSQFARGSIRPESRRPRMSRQVVHHLLGSA